MVSNDPSEAPVPGRLVVREMHSLQMQGPPPFRKMTVIDPFLLGKPPSCSLLLAQDLNGDGLSEIIVVGANLLFTNMGNGRFDKRISSQSLSRDLPMPDSWRILREMAIWISWVLRKAICD
jgi:hypothetical protein